jgi:hypothetical protein
MDDGFGRKAAIRSSTKPRGLARQGWSRIFRALAQRILAHPCTTPNFGIELAKYPSGRGQQPGPLARRPVEVAMKSASAHPAAPSPRRYTTPRGDPLRSTYSANATASSNRSCRTSR